jgi:hypothetical protein
MTKKVANIHAAFLHVENNIFILLFLLKLSLF